MEDGVRYYLPSESPSGNAISCDEKQWRAWARRGWYRLRDEVRQSGVEQKIREAEADLEIPAMRHEAERKLRVLRMWERSGEAAARYAFMAELFAVWVVNEAPEEGASG